MVNGQYSCFFFVLTIFSKNKANGPNKCDALIFSPTKPEKERKRGLNKDSDNYNPMGLKFSQYF